MKIAVIGGGGVRSMFSARSLSRHAKALGLTEVVFMDNDLKKLNIYGKMAEHVAHEIDPDVNFKLTSDPEEAVRDADFIITTIRAGGDEMRVKDERAALALGILGQETTGAAGFSFAMRSVPALAYYCELAKKLAKPDVKVFNFTNPAGVVSQTLRDMGYDFTFGICDTPSSILRSIASLYQVSSDEVTGDCYGLNHLSYFNSIKVCGKEVLPELLDNDDLYEKTDMKFFGKDLAKHVGCVLNEYLYYFYYRQEAVNNILASGKTRGEVICEVNTNMTEELSRLDIDKDFDKAIEIFDKWSGIRASEYMANETGKRIEQPSFHFDINEPDDGGYAGVVLAFIEAFQGLKQKEMTLCVPNCGAIEGMQDDDVVEVSCTINKDGYFPHKIKPAPVTMELIRSVKAYERLASEAIRTRSISKAIDCLMVHPLVNSYSFAKTLVEQYVENNKAYSEGWK